MTKVPIHQMTAIFDVSASDALRNGIGGEAINHNNWNSGSIRRGIGKPRSAERDQNAREYQCNFYLFLRRDWLSPLG